MRENTRLSDKIEDRKADLLEALGEKYPNVIFYLSIDYFNKIFCKNKYSLIKNYKVLHEIEIKNYQDIKKIFKFLKIKKFLSIDDQRVMQVFLSYYYNLSSISSH